MSRELPPDILNPLKELITEISGFEEHTEPFSYILKHFTVKLRKSGTTHFVNKRDIDSNISSMCEKFSFHGFFRQASALNLAYRSYIPDLLSDTDKMNRLSMVKFLLCMSQSPTKHFLEHPEVLVQQAEQPEEVIDWGAYLNEGIEQWNPQFEETSDEESNDSIQDESAKELVLSTTKNLELDGLTQIRSTENMCVMNLKRSREELLATIQHTWYFIDDGCFMKPESDHREANIGILWEGYVKESVHDLIPLKEPSILSEYIVIREVLWQLQCPHNSSVFEFVHGSIRPRPDVTLASVRSFSFYDYMSEFINYIELLGFFREFERLLQFDLTNDTNLISSSYHSYCSGLKKILSPVYRQLCDLEDKVREQECTYTLLNLADDLRKVFKPVKILKEIHEEVILHPHRYNSITCTVNLITKLHGSLDFIVNKQEQDLKLTLFLNSLYPYLSKTDSWLTKDELCDYTDEYLIKPKVVGDQKCVDFEVVERCEPGSLLNLFFDKVLEIGRNVAFLRQLGKHSCVQFYKDSIYTEFVQRVLEKIRAYNGTTLPEESNFEREETDSEFEIENLSVFGPAKTDPNLCKLENMVDFTDGFLMAAFQDFFIKKPLKNEEQQEESLYQKISNATTHVFPKPNFFEPILLGVIERRFSGTGLLVKDILLNEYFLDKQFAFLKHLFLFDDDLIFPVYKSVFNQANSSNQYRPNNVWLTLQLHDIFSDIYPNFYTKTSVQVQHCPVFVNSLKACDLITISYDISWPLTIIVSPADFEQYNRAFQFVLKIKWALHTLNHLRFSDLGAESGQKHSIKMPTFKNKAVARLVRLKFCLVNLLNSLQHFVFGSVFAKISLEFEANLSKAQDLNSLIEIHGKFVKSVAEIVSDLQMKMSGRDESNNILNCVKLLKMMWGDLSLARYATIDCCFNMYQTFLKDVSPVIFPLYKYNY